MKRLYGISPLYVNMHGVPYYEAREIEKQRLLMKFYFTEDVYVDSVEKQDKLVDILDEFLMRLNEAIHQCKFHQREYCKDILQKGFSRCSKEERRKTMAYAVWKTRQNYGYRISHLIYDHLHLLNHRKFLDQLCHYFPIHAQHYGNVLDVSDKVLLF